MPSPRPRSRWRSTREEQARYVSPVFAPLIAGFVVFVLIAVFLGWVMDTSRHGGSERDGH
ncbi:MAG: hypothetical protein QOJ25_2161 [Solirubrobacteraceae bacterium]|jgi:hypothetical protein|nr:hypothetical protein [Solirubrobacteraceae bacterium]